MLLIFACHFFCVCLQISGGFVCRVEKRGCSDICPRQGAEGFFPGHPLLWRPVSAGTHAHDTFTCFYVPKGPGEAVGVDGASGGRTPASSVGATLCAMPGPPFPAHHIIQARFLSLFCEKPCVSTGVAGVLAPRDCACAPAWQEKCRLGENPESGGACLASGAGEGRGVRGGGRKCGRGRWLASKGTHCCLPSWPGGLLWAEERGPHKVTARSRAAGCPPSLHLVPLPPSLPPFLSPSLHSFFPSFLVPSLLPSSFPPPSALLSSSLPPSLFTPSPLSPLPPTPTKDPRCCCSALQAEPSCRERAFAHLNSAWWGSRKGARGVGIIRTLLKVWAVLLGALLYLEGQRRPLKGWGNLPRVSVFQGERFSPQREEDVQRLGDRTWFGVCEEAGRFRED